jgi:hypothetical protein
MYNKVNEINKVLANQGARAIQKKPGLGNRPALYGYLPQIVFDAVNQVVGPENWSSVVDEHFLNERRQAIVLVTVKMFKTERTQFGESGIVKGDEGSARKGAVTDAIQKALALFGVGSAAYRGELKVIFDSKVSAIETDDNFEALKADALEASNIGIEKGRTWWKQNLVHIQILTKEQRADLVEALAGPGNRK